MSVVSSAVAVSSSSSIRNESSFVVVPSSTQHYIVKTLQLYAVVSANVLVLHQRKHVHLTEDLPILHVRVGQIDLLHCILHSIETMRAQHDQSVAAATNHSVLNELLLETAGGRLNIGRHLHYWGILFSRLRVDSDRLPATQHRHVTVLYVPFLWMERKTRKI